MPISDLSGAETADIFLENKGHCPCCRAEVTFRSSQAWLRDFYICDQCGSIPRLRHLQTVLDEQFPGWEHLSIHESSPSANFIQRYAHRYDSSQYFPGVASGQIVNGVRCEDVEHLSLADESIDLFVTQDVLEHVLDPAQAIREIHRVLRPGGAHIFTTPKRPDLLNTRQRAAARSDGTIEHLMTAEYHGSPVGDGRILVTYDYGQDFELALSRWAGTSVHTIRTVDRSRGLDAEFNEVFIIAKPSRDRYAGRGISPQLYQDLSSRDELIQRQQQEIATWQAAVHDITHSTSWRVTAPLRTAADRLKTARAARKRP